MTPLTRVLTKHLPRWAVGPALTLVYVATLLALVVLISRGQQGFIYLDIGRGK